MEPDPLLARHRSGTALLDTNLLLLYLVGVLRRDLVESFKRTRGYTLEDWDLLDLLLGDFERFVTTPHVLTEVSNLGGQLQSRLRTEWFELLARFTEQSEEHLVRSRELVGLLAFRRLGITDVAVAEAGSGGCLVLTADLDLYLHCLESGVDAVNFNHLRPAAWS